MSKSSAVVLFVAVAIALCGFGLGQAQQPAQQLAQPVAKWEYKAVQMPDANRNPDDIAPALNEVAAQGWELQECYIAAVSNRSSNTPPQIAIFKRPAK
jgi:hypothetical protein